MSLTPEHLQQVDALPSDWELIPTFTDKGPAPVSQGSSMRVAWKSRSWNREQLEALNGTCFGVGVKLGPDSGGLLVMDYDARKDDRGSAIRCFEQNFGFGWDDLPQTVAWTSGKPGRAAVAFVVPMDWWEAMPNRRTWGDGNGDLLEARFRDHYSVVIGAHPETAGYHYLPGRSPEDVQVAEAPEWLLEVITRREEISIATPSSGDAARAVEMLKCISPEGNDSYAKWLRVGIALHHTDEGLLEAWTDWSRQMDNFDSDTACLKKWQSFKTREGGLSIASLHEWAKVGGYKEPKAKPSGGAEGVSAIDEWDVVLKGLVDPEHPCFEKNSIRRQIRAATSARELGVSASPLHVRATLLQHQRNLITGTAEKGTKGGEKAKFKQKEYLINNLIAMRCLTGIAAFNKVGKTKVATELVASLIHQTPFMGNPEWIPAPPPPEGHKFILWWVDQPGADSSNYLKARGLMDADGTLHPQIVSLYTEEDDLAWDDQGMDRLIQDTANNPGAILITDSFFACIQRVHGNDQEPEAGGALIDIQTLLSQTETTHVCLFHSPKETGPVGINAIRGHGSAGGCVSGCISMHFLEKKDPQTGKWVADKENPHRRMVYEGRGPYIDLLIRGDWEKGTFNVLGNFQQKLGELTADHRKASTIDDLTDGQKQTLEWVGSAIGLWKTAEGVSANQVASAITHPLQPTASEVETTRKQLNALVKNELLTISKKAKVARYNYRAVGG